MEGNISWAPSWAKLDNMSPPCHWGIFHLYLHKCRWEGTLCQTKSLTICLLLLCPSLFFLSSVNEIFSSFSFSLARGRVWPAGHFLFYGLCFWGTLLMSFHYIQYNCLKYQDRTCLLLGLSKYLRTQKTSQCRKKMFPPILEHPGSTPRPSGPLPLGRFEVSEREYWIRGWVGQSTGKQP